VSSSTIALNGHDRDATGGLTSILECHECGLRHEIGHLAPGSSALCRRCGSTLRRIPVDSLDRSLALVVGGLILIVIANTMPFMSLKIQGRLQEADLITGAIALLRQGMWPLAAVVAATTVMAPLLKLGATFYVLAGLRLPHPPPRLPLIFRWLEILRPWAMIEVYLLGVFVAYVKLIDLATIEIGVAFYALAALMLVMVAIDIVLGPEVVWAAMERRGLVTVPTPAPEESLLLCEACSLVAPVVGHDSSCPRCGAHRHFRKPDSIMRAWALMITAIVLYIPANAYPVMTVISFGSGSPDTILSGVKELALAGMWPLALLVFFASITVPVLKIVGLAILLITTQRRSHWRLRDRTVLYRIVESIGRWSMIDVFMISILVGLVRLGAIATIEPGVGAIAFAAVVITTMIAATCFDPRLMWDAAGEQP
jgi:paraquat-inducible protein A